MTDDSGTRYDQKNEEKFTLLFEMIGVSLLFIKQNSPLVILIVLGVVFLVIGTMVAYIKIESKYMV